MRTLKFLSLLALSACASSGPNSSSTGATPAVATQTVRVQTTTGNTAMTMTGSDASSVHTLPYSVDQVWRALPGAFASVGIPVQTLDAPTKTIGATSFAIRRKLNNVPLSKMIDCGNSQFGPNADDYDVRITFVATVSSAAGGAANVTTTMDASAKPMNYAQEFSNCSSKGMLESRLIDAVKATLAR